MTGVSKSPPQSTLPPALPEEGETRIRLWAPTPGA